MHYEHHRYVGKICVVTGAANGLGLNLAQLICNVAQRPSSERQGMSGGQTGGLCAYLMVLQ